jgi:hypothetical protein
VGKFRIRAVAPWPARSEYGHADVAPHGPVENGTEAETLSRLTKLNAPPTVAPVGVVPGGVEPRISPVNRAWKVTSGLTGVVITLVTLQ